MNIFKEYHTIRGEQTSTLQIIQILNKEIDDKNLLLMSLLLASL